jgi:hypothetical protein
LTGLRRSGSGCARRSWLRALQHSGRNTRGAHSFDCSMSCAKPHAVMLSRTPRQLSDLFVLFCRPTVPHAAAFILPSLGRGLLPPSLRDPSPNCDRTKEQIKHPGSRFRASSLQSIRRIFGDRRVRDVSPDQAKPGAGAAAAVPAVCNRAQEGDKQTGLGRRGSVRCCG